MVKLLVSLVLLVPTFALADCATTLGQVEGQLATKVADASGAVLFAQEVCPGGFTEACWPLSDEGDALMGSHVTALDADIASMLTDCAGETDPGLVAWHDALEASAALVRAQYQYLRDLHVGFTP
jgi:hypothetical protein